MNRVARMLAITGFGVIGGLTLAAGPAQAASAHADSPAKPRTASARTDWGNNRVVGVFSSYRRCDSAGDRGENRGLWKDYDCNRVRFGSHRGGFALSVDYGWRGHHGHGFPGHGDFPGGHGPGFPGGGHGPGFPGDHGPGFPGHGPDGHGPDGHGPDSHGPDGHGQDSQAPDSNAPGTPGPDNHGPDGHGPDNHGPDGHGPHFPA